MPRRHLRFTLEFSLDDDECRRLDVPMRLAGGDSQYTESIDLLRTALHHQAALILAPYDAELAPPEITTLIGSDDYLKARGAVKGTMPAEEAIRRTRGYTFEHTTGTVDDTF